MRSAAADRRLVRVVTNGPAWSPVASASADDFFAHDRAGSIGDVEEPGADGSR
jgi:hypothetical protein